MTHIRQELTLGEVGLFRSVLRLNQVGFRPPAFSGLGSELFDRLAQGYGSLLYALLQVLCGSVDCVASPLASDVAGDRCEAEECAGGILHSGDTDIRPKPRAILSDAPAVIFH